MAEPLQAVDAGPAHAQASTPAPAPRGLFARLLQRARTRRFRWVRRVRWADEPPRGFGVAWVEWRADEVVCMPVPLNVLVALSRAGWLWCLRAGLSLPGDNAEAYAAGFQAGLASAARRQALDAQLQNFPVEHP
jgi:hypothetical protein